jgi:hypothetical protein
MEFAAIGIAVAFNFLIIKVKFEKQRYADAILDLALLATISLLFAGSFGGLVVATIASAIVSLYLLVFPPKLPKLSPKVKEFFSN